MNDFTTDTHINLEDADENGEVSIIDNSADESSDYSDYEASDSDNEIENDKKSKDQKNGKNNLIRVIWLLGVNWSNTPEKAISFS